MADDSAFATGPRSCRADRRRRRRAQSTSARAASASVPIEHRAANPRNPRQLFSDTELAELAASIHERGIIQPIVVRAVRGAPTTSRSSPASGAGARRSAPACMKCRSSCSKHRRQALELAIIENVQRADLNPLEEATGYQALANEFNHTQDDIAKIVGKSRSHIANTLRLLKLPETVKAYINSGKLTAGHARVLIGHPDPEAAGAKTSSSKGLNVRQVEALGQEQAARQGQDDRHARAGERGKDADTLALEKRLSDVLGLVVGIDHRGKGGVLRVRYRTLDQLDEVIRRLESGPATEAGAARVRRT